MGAAVGTGSNSKGVRSLKVKAVKTFACGRYYMNTGETADISTAVARTVLRLGLAEKPAEESEKPAEEPVQPAEEPDKPAEELVHYEKKPVKQTKAKK